MTTKKHVYFLLFMYKSIVYWEKWEELIRWAELNGTE